MKITVLLTQVLLIVMVFFSSFQVGLANRGDITGVTGITVPGAGQATTADDDRLISEIIQTAINWVLGILALISLVLLLYGGFLVLTSAGAEDGYTKGLNILKNVGIGLVFIGLARFLVSMIFYLIDFITTPSP